MSEKDSLVNLKEFFKSVDDIISQGGKIGDLWGVKTDRQVEPEGIPYPEKLYRFHIKILDDSFPIDINSDTEVDIEYFKNDFELKKSEVLNDPTYQGEERELLEQTEWGNLSESALRMYNELGRLALDGTGEDYNFFAQQMRRWDKIYLIILQASKI